LELTPPRFDLLRDFASYPRLQHHYFQSLLASLQIQHAICDKVSVRHWRFALSDSNQSAFHGAVLYGALPDRLIFPR